MIEKNTVFDDNEESMAQKEDERLPAKLDSLKAYLALLSKFPLLSLQEEREITRLVYEDKNRDAAEKVAAIQPETGGEDCYGILQYVPQYP